jgi:hypothetical protein
MDELSVCEIEAIKCEIINTINWDDYEEEPVYVCFCIPIVWF